MDENAQNMLFLTFQAVINDVIADKRKNPKNAKTLDNFNARINLGLQTEEDFIMWVNLVAENGKYELAKGKLDEYDLELISYPEDMMYFTNGKYGVLKMMLTKTGSGRPSCALKVERPGPISGSY